MTTIDNYKLQNTLGSGSFSKVKLAKDEKGNEVALKIMKRESGDSGKELQDLFNNEVAFLKKLDHPNIIKLMGYSNKAVANKRDGTSLNINYMALEYCSHGEIFDYIAETGAFKETIARYYFHQLIDALEYMHTKGYAHRDLKPENLLLDGDFNLKLADFGFATESKTSNSRKGTFGYMAPEVLAKKQYKAQEADLFAAGIILFVMITQHSPFTQADPTDRYYKLISQGRWEQFWNIYGQDTISDTFKDLFQKMMSYNPKDRLSLEEVKQHPWFMGTVAEVKKVRKSLYRRSKKLDKRKDKGDDELRLVTKFYDVDNGDTLVDAAVDVAEEQGYKYKKSKEFYRIIIKIQDEGITTRVQVNVVKKPDEEMRCLELVKLGGDESAFKKAFDKFNEYLELNF
jgi:serine/threonine protein kinase